jgi:hypothetical protein
LIFLLDHSLELPDMLLPLWLPEPLPIEPLPEPLPDVLLPEPLPVVLPLPEVPVWLDGSLMLLELLLEAAVPVISTRCPTCSLRSTLLLAISRTWLPLALLPLP